MPAILALLVRLLPFLVRAFPLLAIVVKVFGILHFVRTGWLKLKYVIGVLIFMGLCGIMAVFYIFIG